MADFDMTLSLVIRPEYALPKKSRFPANLAPLIIIFAHREWPLRSLKAKNLDHRQVAWRKLVPIEIEIIEKQWRTSYQAYSTWEGLIEDEERIVGTDHEFVLKLKELSKDPKYNYIPHYKRGEQIKMKLD